MVGYKVGQKVLLLDGTLLNIEDVQEGMSLQTIVLPNDGDVQEAKYWSSKEINELESNEQYYINEIKKDSLKIKHLKNSDQIEKYAREKYFMKRENEDIYLIEFEEDQENKNK